MEEAILSMKTWHRIRKRLRDRLGRWGALLIISISRRLPREKALKMGENLASFAFWALFINRRIAQDNVTIAYGDSFTRKEKYTIARDAFRNLGRTMIDFICFEGKSKEELLSYCKRVDGKEHLERAMRDSPGGIIGLASHLGSWEYAGAWLVANGYHLSAVGKEQPDKVLTSKMIELRESVGIEHIIKTRSGNRAIMKTLSEKKVLGLLADQNGGTTGIFVPFFGKMASTVKGPAQLAMKKKVPVLLIIALWENYEYIVHISKPIKMIDTGNYDSDLHENTRRCQAEIEKMVRKYPNQWMWGHKRWKTRPSDEITSTNQVETAILK